MFIVPLQPGVLDRTTLEDGDHDEGYGITNAEPDDDEHDPAKALFRKDSQVEEQDGDLQEWECGEIQILVEVVDLDFG